MGSVKESKPLDEPGKRESDSPATNISRDLNTDDQKRITNNNVEEEEEESEFYIDASGETARKWHAKPRKEVEDL